MRHTGTTGTYRYLYRLVPVHTVHTPLGVYRVPPRQPGSNQIVPCTVKVKKMECCYCGKTFQPDPPRRQICPACISRRPAHLRESYCTWSAMAAAAEREKEQARQERRDRLSRNLQTQERSAAPAGLSPVSVGVRARDSRDAAAADWRRRNVIPFPGRPLRPRQIRFWPSDGDSAA